MNKEKFLLGMRTGLPIALGYLVVSFSLGIACQNAGLNPLQGMLISLLNNASAGEYAGLTVIMGDAGFAAIALMMLVANARYLLMSTALSQRLDPAMPTWKRLVMGFDVTDEIFAMAIARPGYVDFSYFIGGSVITISAWTAGTVIGIILGNCMPPWLLTGFSVMLFGMFIATIIPAARKDKIVLLTIVFGFAGSLAFRMLPLLRNISSGFATIVLTVVISALAAWIFPKKEEAQ